MPWKCFIKSIFHTFQKLKELIIMRYLVSSRTGKHKGFSVLRMCKKSVFCLKENSVRMLIRCSL
ncbi:Uncharacterised protein [Burkholderia pseudomallei]|nr:Uncharacterised protein [Burkholderia pseudomallei]